MKQCESRRAKSRILPGLMDTLIAISLSTISLTWIFNIPHRKIIVAALISLVGILFFILHGKELGITNIIIGFYLALLNIWAYRILDNKYSLSQTFFWTMLSIAMGILIVKRELPFITVAIPFMLTAGLFLIGTFLNIDNVSDGIFLNMNRNSVSKVVLSYGTLTNLVWLRSKNSKPLIWPSIVILVVAFQSRSRIGLLASILYFGITLSTHLIPFVKNFFNNSIKDKRTIVSMIVSSIAVITIISWMIGNSRISSNGFSSPARLEMVTSYFSELTLKNFLTGFKSSYVVVHGFTHLHNSYLQLLMSTGIISIPLLVTFFLFGMRLFHNSLYLFGLFGILGIYAVVEQFIFFGSGDFILAPLLYLSHALSTENQIPSLSRSR